MTAIQTVSLYAAAFLLLLAGLAIPIAVWRTRTGIALGSGESQPLYLAIRAHGNASEWIPAFVLGLFLLASLDAPAWSIHALGAPLLAARVLHAYGLTNGNVGRSFGIVGTLLGYAALALALGWAVFTAAWAR